LYADTSGNENTAVGAAALSANKNGSDNTAIGADALSSNISGGRNTGNGSSALRSNSTGDGNTAVGFESLLLNSVGLYNTAVGDRAMIGNDEGDYNSAFGHDALRENLTGSSNTVVGALALRNNNGSDNTVSGFQAMFSNLTGEYNVVVGSDAFYSATGASNTVALGYKAGYASNGGGNIFIGYRAGYNENTGHNLYIHNDSTSSPLIYGDFLDRELNINGKQGINKKEPEHDLHIKQTSSVNTRGVRLEYNSDTDFWDTYVDGSDDYNFAYNGSLKSYINDSDGSYNIASDRRLKSQIQPTVFRQPARQQPMVERGDERLQERLGPGKVLRDEEDAGERDQRVAYRWRAPRKAGDQPHGELAGVEFITRIGACGRDEQVLRGV
jgi:hypothetical protein